MSSVIEQSDYFTSLPQSVYTSEEQDREDLERIHTRAEHLALGAQYQGRTGPLPGNARRNHLKETH